MRGVTIRDKNERKQGLSFDLHDLLVLLDTKVRKSSWSLRGVEAVGKSAIDLHKLVDKGGQVDGEDLLDLSEGIEQTIEGVFEAYHSDRRHPWLRIRAVDGTAFDVESEDDSVLSSIRGRFKDVADLPA